MRACRARGDYKHAEACPPTGSVRRCGMTTTTPASSAALTGVMKIMHQVVTLSAMMTMPPNGVFDISDTSVNLARTTVDLASCLLGSLHGRVKNHFDEQN